jgi:phosphoenolpyruvate phosphomutase
VANKRSFVSFTADGITPAHLDLIDKAFGLGELTVAVLSDEALWGVRAIPSLTLDERVNLLGHFKGVSKVVVQNEWSYDRVLEEEKPDFFLHGAKWDQVNRPEKVRAMLSKWGGQLVEVPFQEKLSWLEPSHRAGSATLDASLVPSSDSRRAALGRALAFGRPILALEAHSPLSAMVAESISYGPLDASLKRMTFDALWSSSLTDSTSRAFPDIEALSFDSRVANIREIFRVSKSPLIMDLDTGGEPEILSLRVRELETIGVSAGVIEDKIGLKKNSLLGNDVYQRQATTEEFSKKIEYVKRNQQSREFLLVARVESLILDAGMEDALFRSWSYVNAGADAIMIHSRKKEPSEIFDFLEKFRATNPYTPIVLVPTSYNTVTATELHNRGANIVIYANHMLRAAVPAMQKAGLQILKNGRTEEIEGNLLSIDEILNIIPGTK